MLCCLTQDLKERIIWVMQCYSKPKAPSNQHINKLMDLIGGGDERKSLKQRIKALVLALQVGCMLNSPQNLLLLKKRSWTN